MTGGRRAGEDPVAAARRARAEDRDEALYARRRARQARARAARDRREAQPGPPGEDDWTVAEEDTDAVRRVSPPTPIGESLEAVVARRGWVERLRATSAWSRWGEIVGPDLAARCEPVRIASGVLVVRAESQVWATQLRYLEGQVAANAVEVLGPGTVRAVNVVVGPLEGRTDPAPG